MRARRTMKADASSALAAALLIGLQAILSSLALGAYATPATYDAFGGPICADSSRSQAPGDRHLSPDCCLAGCSAACGSATPSPSLLLLPGLATPVAYPAPRAAPRPEPDRTSIRSRGPPSLV